MNYTHEEILEAVKLIHNICSNMICKDCPFELKGNCAIEDVSPDEWKFADTDGKWRAFYK